MAFATPGTSTSHRIPYREKNIPKFKSVYSLFLIPGRELSTAINPAARIIAHAELFEEISRLYAAGADFVSVPRLIEAQELCAVVQAARENRLEALRQEQDRELSDRREVIR